MEHDYRIKVRKKFDQMAKQYADNYNRCNSLLAFEKFRRMHILKEFVLSSRPSMVLDIGCGSGFVINELNRNYSCGHFFGIDLSYQMLHEASNMYPQGFDLAQALAQEPPLKSESFDLIFALGLVDYLESPMELFESVHGLLKPGGLFIFSFPNANSINRKVRRILRKIVGRTGISAVPLSVGSVYQLLKKCDLDVLETRFITCGNGAILFPWTFAVSRISEKFLNNLPAAKYLAWSCVVISLRANQQF